MATDSKDPATVMQALSLAMRDVQSVRKGDRNQQQGFSFRGIDAVMNAVGPAFRQHGVVAVPLADEIVADSYQTKNQTTMRHIQLRCTFRLYGPAGDYIEARTFGESADSGDKAISKAHSVAYRTCLLQTLCIPTDDPDPDAETHERAAQPQRPPQQPELAQAKRAVWDLVCQQRPGDDQEGRQKWLRAAAEARGLDLASISDLTKLASELSAADPWAPQQ